MTDHRFFNAMLLMRRFLGGVVLVHLSEARDALAYRRLRGEPLRVAEEFTLNALNELVDAALPSPEMLPEDIQILIRQVLECPE